MRPTPHHTTGPFFPRHFVSEAESDLTHAPGHSEPARGVPIELEGTVTDGRGKPAVNVIIELYQADADGIFNHPGDPRYGERDPGFRGWGRAWTTREGRYRFRTVRPGSYPAGPDRSWIRPPHFTLVVLGSGIMRPLVTEAFLPGEPGNEDDRQLALVPPRLRQRLVAWLVSPGRYRFDLVLQGAGETPFLGISSL